MKAAFMNAACGCSLSMQFMKVAFMNTACGSSV